MWYFTEIADWWENARADTDKILDQWVEDSDYNTGVMIVASTTKAFTTFGAGFVDILRLGDGVKEGTLKGAGADALRVAAIFPYGKAARTLKSVKGLSRAKIIVDTGGPNCFWVASAKAFAQVSQKFKGRLFASVEDVAKALGMPMTNLWKIPNLSIGMGYLQRIGARIGPIRTVSTVKDILRIVPHDGSVLIIAVHAMEKGRVVGGHAIYAFRTVFGKVRYMDRTVGKASPAVYKSIAEIVPRYPGVTTFVPYQASVIHNVFAKSVMHDIPRLVMPIRGIVATEDQK
jgi:hypothetical protein